jgi:tRNA pseudouridine38-40 synthase
VNIRWSVSYNGNYVNGWSGCNGVFVRDLLHHAFHLTIGESVEFFCSGRTDAFVHAIDQTCHCVTTKDIKDFNRLLTGMNHYLPHFIRINSCCEISETFHARFSTKYRKYIYLIHNNRSESPLLQNRVLWIKKELNINDMQICLHLLIGRHDLSTFCPKSYTGLKIRTTDKIEITEITDVFNHQLIRIYFEAKAFAYHQIRNIIGSILEVGKGNWSIEEFIDRFHKKDRNFGGKTIAAHGLYFLGSEY